LVRISYNSDISVGLTFSVIHPNAVC